MVVTVFPDVTDRGIPAHGREAARRRVRAGKKIRAELYLGSGKFGAQMKYADKRGSPCVVIQGGNEKEKGEVQIKDLDPRRRDRRAEQGSRRLSEEAGRGAVRGARRASWSTRCKKVLARNNVTWG